jgi:hypothetical protein
MVVDVLRPASLGRQGNVFVLEFIGIGRKLTVETMRKEGRHVLGVSAEECQTANVSVVLSSDGEAGNRPAGLLQEVHEF